MAENGSVFWSSGKIYRVPQLRNGTLVSDHCSERANIIQIEPLLLLPRFGRRGWSPVVHQSKFKMPNEIGVIASYRNTISTNIHPASRTLIFVSIDLLEVAN